MDQQKQPETLQAAVDALGITYTAEFVPFSKSRNAKKPPLKPSDYSLNWRVTISKGSRSLTTDYMQGIGHIPGHKHQTRYSVDDFEALKQTCERGKISKAGFLYYGGASLPQPLLRDVMYSLSMDADVIDAGGFEEWAGDFGYDKDSREAERIYQACLKIALSLRAMLGDDGLTQLRSAAQDY